MEALIAVLLAVEPLLAGDARNARNLYKLHCVACHGEAQQGGTMQCRVGLFMSASAGFVSHSCRLRIESSPWLARVELGCRKAFSP